MAKERLDVLLVKRELIETREKAKRMIMAGLVFSKNERLDKPGMRVNDEIPLTVKGTIPYVGRGGFKLEKALQSFDTSVKNKVMVDIGSSTGGFTDCALQNEATLVYAIDVGYNQLAWKLRSDERVIVKERTNFRHVTADIFTKGLPNYATIDVSFISLRLILPVLKSVLRANSEIITLIKPQFEAERGEVGKKGIIRDAKIHKAVLQKVITFAKEAGFQLFNLTYSPIKGGEGNIEFLAHLGWDVNNKPEIEENVTTFIHEVVHDAHESLREHI